MVLLLTYPIQLSRNRRPRRAAYDARPSGPCQAKHLRAHKEVPSDPDCLFFGLLRLERTALLTACRDRESYAPTCQMSTPQEHLQLILRPRYFRRTVCFVKDLAACDRLQPPHPAAYFTAPVHKLLCRLSLPRLRKGCFLCAGIRDNDPRRGPIPPFWTVRHGAAFPGSTAGFDRRDASP